MQKKCCPYTAWACGYAGCLCGHLGTLCCSQVVVPLCSIKTPLECALVQCSSPVCGSASLYTAPHIDLRRFEGLSVLHTHLIAIDMIWCAMDAAALGKPSCLKHALRCTMVTTALSSQELVRVSFWQTC